MIIILLKEYICDHPPLSQVIYAHERSLASHTQRRLIRAFLDATYEGWAHALREPEAATEAVIRAREQAGVFDVEGSYSDTHSFQP